MLGFKGNLTANERTESDRRVQSSLALLYIVNVFTYSIAIVLISYQQYIISKEHLTPEYEMLLQNWKQTPVVSIKTGANLPAEPDFEFVQTQMNGVEARTFDVTNQTTQAFQMAFARQPLYNFLQNFSLLPYCSGSQKLCGGMDHSTKSCMPELSPCSLNKAEIYSDGQFAYFGNETTVSTSMDTLINHQRSYLFVVSTYESLMQIVDLRFGFNDEVCASPKEFQKCSRKGLNFKVVKKFDAARFFVANGLPANNLSTADTVGLYAQRYIKFDIKCRDTMLERISEGVAYYEHIIEILYVQTIFSLCYCIVIGLIINIIHFLLLSDFQFILVLPESDQKTLRQVRKGLVTGRFIAFIPYGFFICYLYFMQAQMYDTLNRILREKCIEPDFEYIISDNRYQISQMRSFQTAIFWIFISGLILEVISIFVVLYRSVNLKKKNLIQLQYENELEIKHDEIQKIFQADTKQKEKPKIRASFTPAEQKAIRVSVVGKEVYDQQNLLQKSFKSRIIEEDEEEAQKPSATYKETARPVFKDTSIEQYGTFQTPTNARQVGKQSQKY